MLPMPEETTGNRRKRRIVGTAAGLILLGVLVVWRIGPTRPARLPPGPRPPQVSLGDSHGVVVAPDGSLWSWGGEENGWPALGRRGNSSAPSFSPRLGRVGTDADWLAVSAGSDHNLALKADGSLWAWGANYRLQLGDGTKTTRETPVRSVPGNDWKEVMAGFVTSHALKQDGTLWAWGLNNFGQLGIGSTLDSPTAVQVGTATNWVKVRTGGVSAAGIQSDGSLWIWGGSPALGNRVPQSTNNLLSPIRWTADTNWLDVSVAFNRWLGIKTDGTLWIWGLDAPVFTGGSATSGETPRQWGVDSDWKACAASRSRLHQVLKKRDGSFWVLEADDNRVGQPVLRRVDLPEPVVSFDAGGRAGAAVNAAGDVWTWGTVLGQLTARDRFLKFVLRLGARFGWQMDLPQPQHEVREEPSKLFRTE